MTNVIAQQDTEQPAIYTSYIYGLLDRVEGILHQHRQKNPALYQMVEEEKQRKAVPNTAPQIKPCVEVDNASNKLTEGLYFKQYQQKQLKEKIAANQPIIHEQVLATQSMIVPRTQARNAKQSYDNVEAMKADREDKVSEQIKAWRGMLPILIKRFAKIPDPRRAKSVKHKLAVVMLYGLFAFIFRLSSRREINRELSGAVIFENLQKLFPELESIPHADTLARLLERMNVSEIEETHMDLIYQLIRNKKFKKLLISGCLPVAIDGTQKLYREGEWHDLRWLSRQVGSEDSARNQQYVYVLEANIVFKNGLTIPLLSEYLKTDGSVLNNVEGKQDNELIAFERLADKLKKYFPRLKIMVIADALFATQAALGQIHDNRWDYVIQFSRNKLKRFSELLNLRKEDAQFIPGQPYYRERYQEFYWHNSVTWGYDWQLQIHLVRCLEKWQEVDKKTGEIMDEYSSLFRYPLFFALFDIFRILNGFRLRKYKSSYSECCNQ